MELREIVSKLLEEKRKNKEIGHSLDADVELMLTPELFKAVSNIDMDLSQIFIVSNVSVSTASELKINVRKSTYSKCARCWQYKEEVGKEGRDLCKRCSDAIK